MPNRIIRAGILTSEKVNGLSLPGEVFYRRLMSIVDDYGRHEAHVALLRAALYPLRLDAVPETLIGDMLAECEGAGLLTLYAVDKKHYLELRNFGQQKRGESKCPAPDDEPKNSSCAAVAQQLPAAAGKGKAAANQSKPVARKPKSSAKRNPAMAKQVPADAHLGVSVSVGVSEGGGEGESVGVVATAGGRPGKLEEVKSYARHIGMSEFEAEKFFDHFQANGWRQGGRTAMKDWKAACRNWQRGVEEFQARRAKNSGRAAARAGAEPEFDPKKPHAHTGGVEVLG